MVYWPKNEVASVDLTNMKQQMDELAIDFIERLKKMTNVQSKLIGHTCDDMNKLPFTTTHIKLFIQKK